MYQLGGLIKFIALSFTLYIIFVWHCSYWSLLLILPLWYVLALFDSLKRGALFFKKIEWEHGPFDYETLPLPVRAYFIEGEKFILSSGFSFKEEGLSTGGTYTFGRSEIKTVIRLFENPATGEWATQSFSFTWNPGTMQCQFIGARWRFISLVKDLNWVTTNAQFFFPTAEGPGFKIRYIDELDASVLLGKHREWVKTAGIAPSAIPSSFGLGEYAQRSHDMEMEVIHKTGNVFWDQNLNGYRYSFNRTSRYIAEWLARYLRIIKPVKQGIEGLRPFFWRIRPSPVNDILRSTPSSEATGLPSSEQKVVAFKIGFMSVFFNRLYSSATGPWLSFFGFIILILGIMNFYDLKSDFTFLHLIYCLAGLFMDFVLMVLVVSFIALFLPTGGQRYTERFGKRLMKFYGDVICFESPHGVTTCVLGKFPEARKVGKKFWVKIPGVESFVLKPSQFEGDGYKVFQEEMEKKKLVRPFLLAALAPWLLIAALLTLVYGLFDVEYMKYSYPKTVQGIADKNEAVFVVSQEVFRTKSLRLGRWWSPILYFSTMMEARNMDYVSKPKVEVWEVDGTGFKNFPVSLLGRNILHLVPVGHGVYLVTKDYNTGMDYGPVYFIYRVKKGKVELVLGKEAKDLLPEVSNEELVFSAGWKPIETVDQGANNSTSIETVLPGGYVYFEEKMHLKAEDGWENTFGIKKNNGVIYSERNSPDDFMDKRIPISREEYEESLGK